jgi:rifampicin phosphotransferase
MDVDCCDVLDWQQVVVADVAIVGTKARNLATARHLGFDTPWMFVVASTELESFVNERSIAATLNRIDETADLALDSECLDKALHDLRAQILARPFSASNIAEIEAQLSRFASAKLRYAVRSSVNVEDGRVASFAGMFESILDCSSVEAVLSAIRSCQASAYTARVAMYCQKNGVKLADLRVSALICEMVGGRVRDGAYRSDISGITFTSDPVSRAVDVMRVEAVPGLGDRLAGGSVNASSFLIPSSRENRDELLTKRQLERLGRICLRLRHAFGNGDEDLDVEWTFDGQVFYVLQVRPDTTPPRRSVSRSLSQPNIWSNANLVEILPGIASPLTWSVMRPNIRWGMLEAQRAVERNIYQDVSITRRFKGRAYLNTAALQWIHFDTFAIPPSQTTRDLGGDQPEIELPPGRSLTRLRRRNRIKVALILARLPGALADHAKVSEQLWEKSRPGITRLQTGEELAALWQEAERALDALPFMLLSSIGTMWSNWARKVLPTSLRARDDDLLDVLLASSGDIAGAEYARAIEAMVSASGTNEFDEAVAAFRARFGHRGFGELELANPRWGEQIDQLVSGFRSIAAQRMERHSTIVSDAEEARKTIFAPQRWLFNQLLSRARRGFRLREDAKSVKVRLVGVLRAVALEVGRRIAEKHSIEAHDVFALGKEDLISFLLGEWDGSGVRNRVAAARNWVGEMQSLAAPPSVIQDEFVDHLVGIRPDIPSVSSGFRGIGVSPGIGEGAARVISGPSDFGDLKKGDIIVADAVDPGWTPLLFAGGGLVAGCGGYLSHIAIVARELGLPAVMNIGNSLSQIASEDVVRVDGSRGLVEILEKFESGARFRDVVEDKVAVGS